MGESARGPKSPLPVEPDPVAEEMRAPSDPSRKNGPLRRAILSDIHGNLEALTAVFDDIDRRNAKGAGITEILCLGDIVGYGPDPLECLRLITRRCAVTIGGNHEAGVVSKAKHPDLVLTRASGYGGRGAREGILWAIHQLYGHNKPVGENDDSTRKLLEEVGKGGFVTQTVKQFCDRNGKIETPRLGLSGLLGGGGVIVRRVLETLLSSPENREALEGCLRRIRERDEGTRWLKRLAELPVRQQVDNALLVHDNPFDPGDARYVLRDADARKFSVRRGFHSVDRVFEEYDWKETDAIFLGHSHVPGVYTNPKRPGKVLVNPGSVGIPRGGRSTASYAVWDPGAGGKRAVKLIRLPLDRLEVTRNKMEKAGLPDKFGDPAALEGEPG